MPLNLSLPIGRLGPMAMKLEKKLKTIGLATVGDLLWYVPFRYDDLSKILKIKDLEPGALVSIRCRVDVIDTKRSWKRRMIMTEAILSDDTGTVKATWFGQRFVGKILQPGDEVYIAGRVDSEDNFSSPIYEKITRNKRDGNTTHTARIVPVYPLTYGITSKQLRFLIKTALGLASAIEDFLPEQIRTEARLPDLFTAVKQIHFPDNQEALNQAERRLKFDELFLIQIQNQLLKKELKQSRAFILEFKEEEIKNFVQRLPFQLTDAQRKAAWEILLDLKKNQPMNRLLNGDVGSGKTVVAAMAMLNTVLNGKQAAIMAPTEILAQQHFNTLSRLFGNSDIKIGLVTSSKKEIRQKRLDKRSKANDVISNSDIIIGTHALIQEKIQFRNLGLVIVDEQHRFGVAQRKTLAEKNLPSSIPTPITRMYPNDPNNKVVEKDLSFKLTGIFFEVHNELGRFCREKQYGDLLEQKLKSEGIKFEREKSIEIAGIKSNFADFIIESRIIIELKTKPFITKEDYYQLLRYLEVANIELGLIVNFRQKFLKPKRVLNPRVIDRENSFGSFGCNSGHSDRYLPHFLSLTATPIPRSLALVLYGDLDLSIIDEMPKGRKKIKTEIIGPERRDRVYNFIREEVGAGRQVFVICPLIDPSDFFGVKSVKEVYDRLSKEIFPDLKIGFLHGRLKSKEKEKTMSAFALRASADKSKQDGFDILVSTSVVEVGVDIQNATVMMIEGAERFGLAQLHQFRGRVGRGDQQSYCFLLADSTNTRSFRRLNALVECDDGFKLAEKDLELRGAGEIFGTRQSGLPDMKFATLFDFVIMKEAHDWSRRVADRLENYPKLLEKVGERMSGIHLE